MRIVLLDHDSAFCAFVRQTLRGTEFVLDQDEISDPHEPAIVLLGATQTAELSKARAGFSLVGLEADGAVTVEQALQQGANDTFYKPIEPRALLALLRVARHRLLEAHARHSPRALLRRALAEQVTGQLVVQSPRGAGTVDVHAGGIAWVERAGHVPPLRTLLSRLQIETTNELCNAILDEARSSARSFVDVLERWRIASREVIHECLRTHLADELRLLLGEPSAQAMLIPYDARRVRGPLFAPDEVLPHDVRRTPPPSAESRPPMQTLPGHALEALRALSVVQGCKGASLINHSGSRIATLGDDIDGELAWSIAHLQRLQPTVVVEEEGLVHFAQALDDTIVLVATFDASEVSVGAARHHFRHCRRAPMADASSAAFATT